MYVRNLLIYIYLFGLQTQRGAQITLTAEGTWGNGKRTHQSKSCCESCGNRDAVTGQSAGFHPSAQTGQSWTFAPH